MRRAIRVVLGLLSLTIGVGLVLAAAGRSTAQGELGIGIDADPSGNTPTSLGPIDSCISVKKGDTVQVDIYVTDVVNLLAWEIYFRYDPSVVTIVDRDVQIFLAASTGSDVFDPSEALPTTDDVYRLAAIDLALPHAPDSGSGVLARLTLKAVASGVSPAEIARVDFDGDGTIDIGPLLTDDQGNQIGPLDPKGFFAGPIANAMIAVDTACGEVTPLPSPATAGTPSSAESPTPEASPGRTASPTATTSVGNGQKSEGAPLSLIAYIAGGVAGALVLITGAAFFVRSRRGRIS